jgi:hypothetical protein
MAESNASPPVIVGDAMGVHASTESAEVSAEGGVSSFGHATFNDSMAGWSVGTSMLGIAVQPAAV